jgi:hypothetical protein
MEKSAKVLIGILVAVIAILLVIVLYTFVVKPKLNGYVVQGQNEGFEFAVVSIMQRAAPPNCQTVPLFYQNQTINLVSVECLQAVQAAQTQQAGQ